MNTESLTHYLLELSTEGYAKDPGQKNNDGSTTIRHTSNDGKWSTVDTYWGGEPYAGCETVMHEEKPIWSLVYYGAVDSNEPDVEGVYGVLRKALANTDASFPVRGPKELVDADMTYQNHWEGDLEHFKGQEWILKGETEVYAASYLGGYVNQREG